MLELKPLSTSVAPSYPTIREGARLLRRAALVTATTASLCFGGCRSTESQTPTPEASSERGEGGVTRAAGDGGFGAPATASPAPDGSAAWSAGTPGMPLTLSLEPGEATGAAPAQPGAAESGVERPPLPFEAVQVDPPKPPTNLAVPIRPGGVRPVIRLPGRRAAH